VAGPRVGDAFGLMLRAAASAPTGSVAEIIERDDGYIYAQRPDRYFAPPEEWHEFERAALELARGDVLDVGCGAGRFALALQDRGVPVTGIDVSGGAVEVCGKRGVRSVIQGTVAGLAGARFDTFLLMGENLGLLESARRAPEFLAELAAVARPGARIIGHGADPRAAADPYLSRDRPPGQLPGEMVIRVRHRDVATAWFGYLLCSPDELGALARGSGWRLTSVEYADKVNYLAVLDIPATRSSGSQ